MRPKVPVFEHQIYMCSACRHIARRLVFSRAKTPITRLPIPIDKLWKEQVAAPRTWRNAVEKLRSRQIDIKERAAAAKIVGWTKAVEKVRSKQAALAEQQPVPLQPPCAPRRKRSSEAGRRPHSLRTLSGKSRPNAFAVEIDHRSYLVASRAEQSPKPPAEPAFSSYEHGEDKR